MKIRDAVVLITGANRGLGAAFARAAVEAGARKVYAAAREPDRIDIAGVRPIRLDVTSPTDIQAAARQCSDLTLLINNAGIARGNSLLVPAAQTSLRDELETNLHGPLALAQACAPILAANGGGAIINVLSVLSWVSLVGGATYCISKAAAWSLTNGLRNELRTQGTQVLGLHVAYMDTDMTRDIQAQKSLPSDVVSRTFAGLEAGEEEVLADELTRTVQRSLSATPPVYLGTPTA